MSVKICHTHNCYFLFCFAISKVLWFDGHFYGRLESGASVECVDHQGYTPLYSLLLNQQLLLENKRQLIRLLLSFGASVLYTLPQSGHTALHLLSNNGQDFDYYIALFLIEKGGYEMTLSALNTDNCTPLEVKNFNDNQHD